MSVIVELRVEGDEFELGRALEPPEDSRVELERPVSVDWETVPFWILGCNGDLRPDGATEGDAVEELRQVDTVDGWRLYALSWDADGDHLLAAVDEAGGDLQNGRARDDDSWTMKLRFPGQDALSSFRERCEQNGVELEVERLYGPRPTEQADGYGLTDRQLRTLSMAVESGYYDIPRRTRTQELADRLGVSDQAVTERLRRAITSLVEATLLAEEE